MRVLRAFVAAAFVFATSFTTACVGIGLPGKTSTPRTTPTPPSQSSLPPGSSLSVNREFLKLSQTVPDTALEVVTTDGRMVMGRFMSADADGLTMKIDFRLETIKRDDISYVSGYESQVQRYTLIGAAFGVLGGLFAVTNHPPGYGIRVSAMAGGAAVGALGGAFTGTQHRHRVVIYERR